MAIENEQVVSITYELKVDGNVADSNVGGQPLEFSFGSGQIIPGLESRIQDMNVGDSKEVAVPAAEAYGEYNPEAKQVVPKEQFAGLDLEVGMPLQGQGEDGQPFQVTVAEIQENEVVVDFNHPLAGKELNFSITIESIK
jgi:FKBP-type peptidyl-prolyl cis-trans isomerase SlyD